MHKQRNRLCGLLVLAILVVAGTSPGRADSIRSICMSAEPLLTPPDGDYRKEGLFVRYANMLAAEADRADVTLKFAPWKRCQLLVAGRGDMALIPLTRNPRREAAYSWLAPMFPIRVGYAVKAGFPVPYNLEQARRMKVLKKVGTVADFVAGKHKLPEKFLMSIGTNRQILQMLDRDRADAWLGWDLVIRHESRYYPGNLDIAFGYTENLGDLYLAGPPGLGNAEQRRWFDAARRLKARGVLSMFPVSH